MKQKTHFNTQNPEKNLFLILDIDNFCRFQIALSGEDRQWFRKGRFCADNIYSVKRLIEKNPELNLETTQIGIADFTKGFDRVYRIRL